MPTTKSLDASARPPSTAAAPARGAPTGYYWYLPAGAEEADPLGRLSERLHNVRSQAASSPRFQSEQLQRERRDAEANRDDAQPQFDRATAEQGDAAARSVEEISAGEITVAERVANQGETWGRQTTDPEAATLLFSGRVPGNRWLEAQRQLRQQLESLGLQPTADGTAEPRADAPGADAPRGDAPAMRQRVAAAEPESELAVGAAVDGVRPPLSAANPQTIRVAVDASPETALALQSALEQQVRSLGGTLETTAAGTAVGDGFDATQEMLGGRVGGGDSARGGMGGGVTADFGTAPPLLRRNALASPTQRPRMLIELSVDRAAAEPAAAPGDPQP